MNEIRTIGIIGSGKMGSDLFNYISDFGFHIVWFTRNEEHKEILEKTFTKKIKRQLKHGVINQDVFDLKNNYRITTNLEELSECNLIIESVIEERDVKVELFQRLEEIVKPSCVLVSNSSSILPAELCGEIKYKNRVLGLHFFYPIAFKNIVEVIVSEDTDELSVEKVKLFLEEIKRFYLIQNTNDAFILNRMLLQIQVKAYEIVEKNDISFRQLDNVSKQTITEFGLFEVMDSVGHNTMYNAILNYSRMDEDKYKYQPLLNELKRRYPKADKEEHMLFYDQDLKDGNMSSTLSESIRDDLNSVVEYYMKEYAVKYQINIYSLKKGFEEFCGFKL